MIPPWEKYPDIPLGSMGWRMGAGEDYWFEFDAWFVRQSHEARMRYVAEHPEPRGWEGFYARKDDPRS